MSNIKTNYKKNYYSQESSGVCVVKREGETIEDLIRRFKKKFSKSGILRELKDRMYFEKPSDKKRRKRNQSLRNTKQELEKQKLLDIRKD